MLKQYTITAILLITLVFNVNAQFSGGSGTESDPYLISNLDDLQSVSENETYWSSYFIQTTDIDATETNAWNVGDHDNNTSTPYEAMGFTPIADSSYFNGSFNGGGFIISNLFINRPAYDNVGFFSKVFYNNGTIENLHFENIYVLGHDRVGGLIGFVGYNNNALTLNNLSVNGEIHGENYVGGLIGENWWEISNSSSQSIVNGISYVGGLVGTIENDAEIFNSYSNCDVSGTNNIGGFAGNSSCSIYRSYSSGTVTGIEHSVGGFVGTFNNCTQGISDCYSTCTVSGNSEVGGFIGNMWLANVFNSYCTGLVTGNIHVKAFIGHYPNNGLNAYSSFANNETSGLEVGNLLGRSTDEMQNLCLYLEAGWDFVGENTNGTEDRWVLNSSENSGFPVLTWQMFDHTEICCVLMGNIDTNITNHFICNNESFIYLDGTEHANIVENETHVTVLENQSINGCDSVIVENLNVLGLATVEVTVCWGDSYIFIDGTEHSNITVNEEYISVLSSQAMNGCDSIITELVSVNCCTNGFENGSGTVSDPYQISNLCEIKWLSEHSEVWDNHFIQSNNIDVSTSNTWNVGDHDNYYNSPYEPLGFLPIGTETIPFKGSYNAKGHAISGMFINQPSQDNIGMFGYLENALIDSLILLDINITASHNVGAIVGSNISSTVSNSSASGEIIGNDIKIGGLIGSNLSNSMLENSSNYCLVTSQGAYIGGLVGWNENSIISRSFNSGTIQGNIKVGGIVGDNHTDASILKCYNNGLVSGSEYVGGLSGINYSNIFNSYNSAIVEGISNTGGLVGSLFSGNVENSFWDKESSGQEESFGGTAKTTAEMKDLCTYLVASWDFDGEIENGLDDEWVMNSFENDRYPALAWQGIEHTEECVTDAISEQSLGEFKLKVFPNPANNYILIEGEILNSKNIIEIIDITGKSIFTQKNEGCNSLIIDVTSLNKGVYLIKVENESVKIVKE